MYNEQIEALISAALADGVLTEKRSKFSSRKQNLWESTSMSSRWFLTLASLN